MISWGQAPFPIFVDFKSIIFCYKDQIWQFFQYLLINFFFPQGIEATEKLEQDHAANVEALEEELAKVKSAGEESVLNISHAFSSEAPFYKAPPLFGHCIVYFYIYFTLFPDKVWNQYKRWNDDSRPQS